MSDAQSNGMSSSQTRPSVRFVGDQTLEIPARTCFVVIACLSSAIALLTNSWLRAVEDTTIVGTIALLSGALLAWRYLQHLDLRERNMLRQHEDRLRLEYDFLEVEPRPPR